MRASARRWVAVLALAALAAAGCGRERPERGGNAAGPGAGQETVAMSDEAYDALVLDTFEKSACTPKVDDDFEGLRIAMPARRAASQLERIPLCGIWSFSNATLARFPMVEDSLVWMVRCVETNESASGNFRVHRDPATAAEMQKGAGEGDRAAPPGADSLPELGDEDIVTRGFFNFDLGRVWQAPARPGHWRVHLALHEVQSNEVVFEVTK